MYEISTTDQLHKAAEYRPMIITFVNGAPVRLGDIADVQDSVEDRRNAGYYNGTPAVLVTLFKQPQANIIDTVDRVTRCFRCCRRLFRRRFTWR